jgi:hypothetical protein
MSGSDAVSVTPILERYDMFSNAETFAYGAILHAGLANPVGQSPFESDNRTALAGNVTKTGPGTLVEALT